jgi:hypothetical protein
MPTVTISATDYAVYADLPAANAFLAADFGATDWRAETDTDEQKRALVTATRLLNRLNWAADRDWPRPGTDDTQTAAVPQPVIDASIALAKLIRLPVEISELIGPYLAGATIGGALASGTCGKSITCRDFETGWPE